MQHGLYVVTTNFSGPNDFISHDNSCVVKWDLEITDSHDYPNASKSYWCNPNEQSALEQLNNAQILFCEHPKNMEGIKTGMQYSVLNLASRYKAVIESYLY